MNASLVFMALALAVGAYLVGRYALGPFSRSRLGRRHMPGTEVYGLTLALSVMLPGVLLMLAPSNAVGFGEMLIVLAGVAIVLGLPTVIGTYVGRRVWSSH